MRIDVVGRAVKREFIHLVHAHHAKGGVAAVGENGPVGGGGDRIGRLNAVLQLDQQAGVVIWNRHGDQGFCIDQTGVGAFLSIEQILARCHRNGSGFAAGLQNYVNLYSATSIKMDS